MSANKALHCVTKQTQASGVLLDLTMYETLIRPHDVHQVPKLVSIDSIVEQVKLHELKREQRRLQQVAASDKKRESRKRKREEAVADEEDGPDPDLGTGDQKRRREGDNTGDTATLAQQPTIMKGSGEYSNFAPIVPTERKEGRLVTPATSVPMAKPIAESRGHTSYLTFASLLPCKHHTSPGVDENVSDPVEANNHP
ncbi:hypothetical protein FRC17_007941 [Serendipita sp. 399]|nr:hypothetical protein FRC17_007941 [Serendipita sp. 399]